MEAAVAMAVAMEAVEVAEVVEAVAVAAAAVVAAVEGVGLLLVAMGPLEATMAITLMPLVPFKVLMLGKSGNGGKVQVVETTKSGGHSAVSGSYTRSVGSELLMLQAAKFGRCFPKKSMHENWQWWSLKDLPVQHRSFLPISA